MVMLMLVQHRRQLLLLHLHHDALLLLLTLVLLLRLHHDAEGAGLPLVTLVLLLRLHHDDADDAGYGFLRDGGSCFALAADVGLLLLRLQRLAEQRRGPLPLLASAPSRSALGWDPSWGSGDR